MFFPIPPCNFAGKSLTAYWEDFLTEEDIQILLSQPGWDSNEEGGVGNKTEGHVVDANVRRTKVGWLEPTPETFAVWTKIAEVISEVNRQFFHFELTGVYEPIQLAHYKAEEESHYTWHTDATFNDRGAPRKLSMVLLLTDPSEFEGGELQVMMSGGAPETLELKKGRAWFMPSVTLHRVTPVTKGVRKSAVVWVGGPAFK
jgi:PKHD-type hydroxylase